MGKLTGREDYLAAAAAVFRRSLAILQQSPTAASQMLLALDMYLGPTPEIVILAGPQGHENHSLLANLHRLDWPNKVVAYRDEPAVGSERLAAMFAGKQRSAAGPAVYLCHDFACQTPVVGFEAAIASLDRWRQENR